MHTQAGPPKVPRATWSVNESLPAATCILNESALETLCSRAALEVPDKQMLQECQQLLQLMESVRESGTATDEPMEVEHAAAIADDIPSDEDGTHPLPRDTLTSQAPGRTRAGFFVAP